MTAIPLSVPHRRQFPARATISSSPPPVPGDDDVPAPPDHHVPATGSTGTHGPVTARSAEPCPQASAPGVIGGAIIKAARRSARLSRRRLAGLLTISPATIRLWENGSCPLFTVTYGQLCQLASAFH